MWYSTAADAVLLVHLAFVLWVIAGAFAVLRWPVLAWVHVPAAVWGVYIEWSGRICPLTPLENHLRERAGEAAYTGGFIEHYVTAWLYPEGLTRSIQLTLGLVVLLVNVVVYAFVLRRLRRRSAA